MESSFYIYIYIKNNFGGSLLQKDHDGLVKSADDSKSYLKAHILFYQTCEWNSLNCWLIQFHSQPAYSWQVAGIGSGWKAEYIGEKV